MDRAAIEYLGWAATAVFVSSYFCARPDALKRVQMAGAAMWMVYGVLIGAVPVVAANLLVFAAAAWTARRATGLSGATPRSLRSDRAPT
jgi:inner membrane protein